MPFLMYECQKATMVCMRTVSCRGNCSQFCSPGNHRRRIARDSSAQRMGTDLG